jgi:hypothetical protein
LNYVPQNAIDIKLCLLITRQTMALHHFVMWFGKLTTRIIDVAPLLIALKSTELFAETLYVTQPRCESDE